MLEYFDCESCYRNLYFTNYRVTKRHHIFDTICKRCRRIGIAEKENENRDDFYKYIADTYKNLQTSSSSSEEYSRDKFDNYLDYINKTYKHLKTSNQQETIYNKNVDRKSISHGFNHNIFDLDEEIPNLVA